MIPWNLMWCVQIQSKTYSGLIWYWGLQKQNIHIWEATTTEILDNLF